MLGLSLASQTFTAPPELISLHGHGVRLRIDHPVVARPAARVLATLAEEALPFEPIEGEVADFVHKRVMRHVADDAVRVHPGEPGHHPLYELFRSPAGDRWWQVDERWGLSEIDLVRGRWRSFVLPAPRIDAMRLFEATVWWPMAHLLAGRGLHLVPASSLAGPDGGGTLILSPGNDDREAAAAGPPVRVVGARWTAIRQDLRGLDLLAMPGSPLGSLDKRPLRLHTDVAYFSPRCQATCRRARCRQILIATPDRGDSISSTPILGTGRLAALRRAWPMPTLSPASTRFLHDLAGLSHLRRARLARDGYRLVDHLCGNDALKLAA